MGKISLHWTYFNADCAIVRLLPPGFSKASCQMWKSPPFINTDFKGGLLGSLATTFININNPKAIYSVIMWKMSQLEMEWCFDIEQTVRRLEAKCILMYAISLEPITR